MPELEYSLLEGIEAQAALSAFVETRGVNNAVLDAFRARLTVANGEYATEHPEEMEYAKAQAMLRQRDNA